MKIKRKNRGREAAVFSFPEEDRKGKKRYNKRQDCQEEKFYEQIHIRKRELMSRW